MTATIALTWGHVALVDDADLAAVTAAGPWHASVRAGKVYAARNRYPNGQREVLYLHSYLLGASLVDHINNNGLDNRRANLRPATSSQNNANRGPNANSKSGYKGVSWSSSARRWVVQITKDRRKYCIGHFDNVIEAALAYDRAARQHHGEFAWLNFPNESVVFFAAHESEVS